MMVPLSASYITGAARAGVTGNPMRTPAVSTATTATLAVRRTGITLRSFPGADGDDVPLCGSRRPCWLDGEDTQPRRSGPVPDRFAGDAASLSTFGRPFDR